MNAAEQAIFGLLLMNDSALLDQLRYGVRLMIGDFSSPDANQLYIDILATADAGHPVTPGVVAAVGERTQESLENLVTAAFGVSLNEAIAHAQQIVEQKERAQAAHQLEAARTDLLAGKPLVEVHRAVSSGLLTGRGITLQEASLGSIHHRMDEKIAAGVRTFVTPTGIPWFDFCLSGGLRSKRLIGLGGRQKGRKTSIARNWLLGAAMRNMNANPDVSIAYLCYENDQEITYYDLVAMIGMKLLVESGNANQVLSSGDRTYHAHRRMDGEIIQTAYENGSIDRWPPLVRNATRDAMAIADRLPIWVYDSEIANGGLENLASLEMVVEMHSRTIRQDHQHLIICIDYAQLVENIGKDYEDMKAFSKKALWMSQHYEATVIALSQFNEQSNLLRATEKKPIDYVGTKGGGSLEAAVQNYFVSTYEADTPNLLNVRQQRARRAPNVAQTFVIHPASGLILGVAEGDKSA